MFYLSLTHTELNIEIDQRTSELYVALFHRLPFTPVHRSMSTTNDCPLLDSDQREREIEREREKRVLSIKLILYKISMERHDF